MDPTTHPCLGDESVIVPPLPSLSVCCVNWHQLLLVDHTPNAGVGFDTMKNGEE